MDDYGSFLEDTVRQASVILRKFTNEQLDILKQAFQQTQYPNTQGHDLLAEQFNTDPVFILLLFRYYYFQALRNDHRRRYLANVAA